MENKIKLKINKIKREYPKYSTQIMNIANQNSGATRPKNVGQLSDLFPQFLLTETDHSLENWSLWYKNKMGNVFDEATRKVLKQVNNTNEIIPAIDEDLVKKWITELIINKTYEGMIFQYEIVKDIANNLNLEYRMAKKEEESKNIDAFINDKAVQIKAKTFKTTNAITKVQNIDCQIITYTINDESLSYEFDPNYFK